ncbi:3-oxoacyl-ACP reductase family protein [Caulobacter sp. 17J65-9]|uniref:3-oxoacyl-ACP reductase family protein n=1 Tax=Caulobacter sp. 17J65-9 TaxID=2709382 RepID=UPI001969A48B|nr:3-oxoacyl-ACP reductase family protein [Caulobacter sp. 17J65-9]
MTDLKRKVALVTGGSRGIGAAIAKRLAADGAAVAITYTASSEKADAVVKAIEADGGKALAIQADAADPAQVKAAVARTVEALGGLDILVNNAGVLALGPIGELALEDFDRTLAVNVRGVFVASQEAQRHMKDGGRIINIGSVNSDIAPFPGLTAYSASKGAVAALTIALARELGPRGITVNNLQPGPVDTDMNPAAGDFADTLRGIMALGRYGHADEIAGLVAYLASDQGGYVTGANLRIDGGFGL